MHTAVVDDLAIGYTHIRNVAFLILPDSQQPMRSATRSTRSNRHTNPCCLGRNRLEIGRNISVRNVENPQLQEKRFFR